MDKVYGGFLRTQFDQGMVLAGESDLLDLLPVEVIAGFSRGSAAHDDQADHPLFCRYLAHFSCTGLVRTDRGEIVEANDFAVGIWFPSDYARRANPFQVLTWLGPQQIFHPNIAADAPFICIGRLTPGTPLVDIIYQCFEIITYQKVTMREDDALNKAACAWARRNQSRFPVDRRPLKRRTVDVSVTSVEVSR